MATQRTPKFKFQVKYLFVDSLVLGPHEFECQDNANQKGYLDEIRNNYLILTGPSQKMKQGDSKFPPRKLNVNKGLPVGSP